MRVRTHIYHPIPVGVRWNNPVGDGIASGKPPKYPKIGIGGIKIDTEKHEFLLLPASKNPTVFGGGGGKPGYNGVLGVKPWFWG